MAETPAAEVPAVSVVVPTYNRARTVGRAVESVLDQTFTDLEVVVVDDGSTDDTREVVQGLGDPRVRYLHQENAGRCAARNRGAAMARGYWLVFLDSDDEAQPGWLEALIEPFSEPRVEVVCCGARILRNRPGRSCEEIVRLPDRLGPACFHRHGLFLCGTFALPRKLFLEIGGYLQSLSHAENTELALRLTANLEATGGIIYNVPEPLLTFHNHRPPVTAAGAAARLEAATTILEQHGPGLRDRSPRSFARYENIAAVNAARLERWTLARQHLGRSIATWPWEPRQYLRLLLATLPPLGRRFWSRHEVGAK